MARRIYCENITCKYHNAGNTCTAPKIRIKIGGKCSSFETGFYYFWMLAANELSHSNFIPVESLTRDLRIGLYYLMRVFHLGMVSMRHGMSSFIMLYSLADKSKKGLNYDDICKLEEDKTILAEEYNKFLTGIMPDDGIETKKPKCDSKPYGWLSPTGVFTPGDFAEHEEVAMNIIKEKGWREEYFASQDIHRVTMARDFLAAKGWCLIHDPSGQNGYLVSHEKPLTHKQNDFLFGYFSDLGDHLRAEEYLTD